MSSTNRGEGVYIRQEDDFYETPAWCVEALFSGVLPNTVQTVLDPCAGRGAILDVAKRLGRETFANEIDDSRAGMCARKGHYTNAVDSLVSEWEPCDAIVTNPPFFWALEFIQKALFERRQYTVGGGRSGVVNMCTLAFLLRLNFLGSQKRRNFHLDYPADLHIMTRRPSFGDGIRCTECDWKTLLPPDLAVLVKECQKCGAAVKLKPNVTDSIEYCWFVWHPAQKGGKWNLL